MFFEKSQETASSLTRDTARTGASGFFLFFFALFLVALCDVEVALAVEGNEEVRFLRPQKPGFRTDVGIHLSFGSEHCLAGTQDHGPCQDFGADWDAGFGMAFGVLVRPGTYLSYALDVSFSTLTGQLQPNNYWLEITIGPAIRLHLPIRFGRFVLEPALGGSFGYAESHLRYKSPTAESIKGSLFGPYVGILCNLSLFIFPGLGIGMDLRIHKMLYQEICAHSGSVRICRGVADEKSEFYSDVGEQDTVKYPGKLSEKSFSWKIYYGGHVVYYF